MNSEIQKHAIDAVVAERLRQDELWGPIPRHLSPDTWAVILTEEVGEVAEATLRLHDPGWGIKPLREELIQVAAVAIAMIEEIDTTIS